jgi:hypothetical protein
MKKSTRSTRRISYKKKGGFVYESPNKNKSNQRQSSIVLTRTASNSRSNSSNKSRTHRRSGRSTMR